MRGKVICLLLVCSNGSRVRKRRQFSQVMRVMMCVGEPTSLKPKLQPQFPVPVEAAEYEPCASDELLIRCGSDDLLIIVLFLEEHDESKPLHPQPYTLKPKPYDRNHPGGYYPWRTRKVDVRLPGKGNSNSHGARPVHLIITMIKWIRTSRGYYPWRVPNTYDAVPT